MTSSLVRTISTAAPTKSAERCANPILDEIKAGAFDGLTYEEIERLHPKDFELREKDKLRYRYPEGKDIWIILNFFYKGHVRHYEIDTCYVP